MTEDELLDRVCARAALCGSAKLGIMGGTFDPVHRGHVALADAAVAELGLDGVLYVPAGRPSFKQGRALAAAKHRMRMVELAVGDRPLCAVSPRELLRPGVTYTADTLLELRDELPYEVRLYFLLGADCLATLDLWNRAELIARLAEVAVAGRGGIDLHSAVARLCAGRAEWRVRVLAARVPEISSTTVRERLAAQTDMDNLLAPQVLRYIEDEGLYGMTVR